MAGLRTVGLDIEEVNRFVQYVVDITIKQTVSENCITTYGNAFIIICVYHSVTQLATSIQYKLVECKISQILVKGSVSRDFQPLFVSLFEAT